MKKAVVVMSILGAIVGGIVSLPFSFNKAEAQAPAPKELQFAVLNDKAGARVAEITVSSVGLHFKVTGYETLNLTFQDVDLLRKASEVYNQ